jgi:hypothetical protein
MKRLITISVLIGCNLFYASLQIHAQVTRPAIINQLQQKEKNQGQIQIVQDKRIDKLLLTFSERNARTMKIPGYQIHIFSDSKQFAKNRADDALASFRSNYPDIEAYSKYESPEYKIYVGNFRTYNEAFKVKMQIRRDFPNAYIIDQLIDINKF